MGRRLAIPDAGPVSAAVLDAKLLEILVCPVDHGPLLYVGDEPDRVLYNPRLRQAYRIDEGIPVLLADEARSVDDEEHARLAELGKFAG